MTKQSIGKGVAIVEGGIINPSTTEYLAFKEPFEYFTQTCHVTTGSNSSTTTRIRQQNYRSGSVRGMRYSMGIYKEFAKETSKVNPSIKISLQTSSPINTPRTW